MGKALRWKDLDRGRKHNNQFGDGSRAGLASQYRHHRKEYRVRRVAGSGSISLWISREPELEPRGPWLMLIEERRDDWVEG